ncbi:MAG: hypothetical protein ACI8Y7_000688 [Candidatus Woesearchaeota archaeon]|jgi:hypothetical protein
MKFDDVSMALLGAELLYALVVFILCFIIFWRTKELYTLTQHKGIYYFRRVFLFFGFAYFLRAVHVFVLLGTDYAHGSQIANQISLFLIGFLSTMAVINLLITVGLSCFSKIKHLILWSYVVAIIPSILVFTSRSPQILMLAEGLILMVALVLILRQSKKAFSANHTTFVMLAVFWIINILAFVRDLFSPTERILLYCVSAGIFVTIYFRVQKRISYVKKKR